jgi:GcrA cell cycle regulator
MRDFERERQPIDWTAERVDLLKRLWADGFSASQCAARMGLGLSRSAVIGKVHRLGLAGRATTLRLKQNRDRRDYKSRRILRQAPKPVKYLVPDNRPIGGPPPDPVVPPEKRVRSIIELGDNQCRWPIGDPREPDFHFCHLDRHPGKSYCELHVRKSENPNPAVRPRFAKPANSVRTGLPLVDLRESETV